MGSTVQVPPDLQPLIERERENILATLSKDDVPGAAVCLLYEGRPVWIEGFGVTDPQLQQPVGADTIFSIQSTSKNFTATAIMLAVQGGLLELDKPIAAYLPNFTVQSRFEPKPQERMTLRLLLSHRAGFTHEAPVGNNYDPAFSDFEAHIRSISQTWLRYPVGERYRYSNLGIDVAGYILQLACRRPFADCLQTMIFDPLKMADSTAATEVYAARKDRAVGHEKGFASVPLKTPLIASGGVYTSARDMAAYLAFHLNRGRAGAKYCLKNLCGTTCIASRWAATTALVSFEPNCATAIHRFASSITSAEASASAVYSATVRRRSSAGWRCSTGQPRRRIGWARGS